MKEKPILCNSQEVRAILAGHKTQTRRPIKPQPELSKSLMRWNSHVWLHSISECHFNPGGLIHRRIGKVNPFGVVGDRLWVRETWAYATDFGNYTGDFIYRSSYTNGGQYDDVDRWRPSIHMPREASRITLEVKRVWVERVRDINPADIRKEGICETNPHCFIFGSLWDSIYGKGEFAWDRNPWVFCCEFNRVKAHE